MNNNILDSEKFFSIENLRAFHNQRFIRLAYRMILRREVDADGLTHYLTCLNNGISPVHVLSGLRNSSESSIFRKDSTFTSNLAGSMAKSILEETIIVKHESTSEVIDQLSHLLASSHEAFLLSSTPPKVGM